MKSAVAVIVAGAALATATITEVKWVYDVVTVTVTVDPTDFVQNSKPTSTPTPEPAPVTTTTAAPAPPPPPPANAAAQQPTTSEAPPPPPATSTPEPVVVVSTQEPAPAPQPTQAQPETLSPSGSYQQTAVDYHNAYRQDHSASGLEWDDTLAQYAANTANSCVFQHDMSQGKGGYGQNLASFGTSGDLGSDSNAVGNAVSGQWYPEVKNYNFYGLSDPPSGVNLDDYGHYSQLVWKSTQKVGCASVKCPAGTVLSLPSYFTVCDYSPPGNFQGQYGANVLPSLGLKITLST